MQRDHSIYFSFTRMYSIHRNRERLLALGLPSLAKKLQEIVRVPGSTPAKKKLENRTAAKRKPARTVVNLKLEDEVVGVRRSKRLRDAASKPKVVEEALEASFDRQLGEFVVNGECPKCGSIYTKGHRNHLISCGGPRAPPGSTRGYSAMDRDLLAGLTDVEKKDSRKRMLARMKALELSNLVEFSPESAAFIVIGSKGDPYTVTLADEKHKCTCLDHRFRRHNCKHICLVLSQVGALETPTKWHSAVEASLDELIARGGHESNDLPPVAPTPRDQDADLALKFAAA